MGNGRPWLLLVPNYVYMKDYYEEALGAAASKRILYLTPPGRYTYNGLLAICLGAPAPSPQPPRLAHLRQPDEARDARYEAPRQVTDGAGRLRKSGEHKTAPYMSFWYIDAHPALAPEELIDWWASGTPRAA